MTLLQAARTRPISILAGLAIAALAVAALVISSTSSAGTDDTRAGAYDLGDITNQQRTAARLMPNP